MRDPTGFGESYNSGGGHSIKDDVIEEIVGKDDKNEGSCGLSCVDGEASEVLGDDANPVTTADWRGVA